MSLTDHPHTEGRARRLVSERAAGLCECCHGRKPLEWAHRVNRSHGGPWCPANGLHLCGDCHRRTESELEEAYRLGIRLKSTEDPHVTPVWLDHVAGRPGWWILDELGCYVAVEVTHAVPRGLSCRHCGLDVHIVNATTGPEWVHTVSGLTRCQPPTREPTQ